MLPLSRALPHGAYGKNFLRNIALDGDERYVDSLSYFHEEKKRGLLSTEFLNAIKEHDSSEEFRRIYNSPASRERVDHLLYLDSKTYLPGDIMTKVDRMSIAHSLEAREPLLDHKLIEFVAQIPASLKLRGSETKSILKRAIHGLIPDEIIDRKKQGFGVPIQQWFKKDLRTMLLDTLTGSRARQRGYFKPGAVEAILDEHMRGRRDNSRHLWGLLTLELWHRQFIDRQPEAAYAGAKQIELGRVASRDMAQVG